MKTRPKTQIPPSPPRLILVMGVAGTGKSELSKAILEQLWAVYLDNNFLADVFSPKSRTDERYLAFRENLYDALYRITEENLRLGNSVLLDAPHIKQVQDPEWRRSIQRLVDESGARLCVIRCYCREQVLRERLEARGEERDRWKLENWETFLTQEPARVPIPFPHLELDTEDGPEVNVAQAVSYILEGREP